MSSSSVVLLRLLCPLFGIISKGKREREERKKVEEERKKSRLKVQHYVLNLVCFEIVIVHRFRRSTSPLGRAHGWLSRRNSRLVAVKCRRRPPRHFSCFVGSKTNTNCSRRRKRLYFCVLCVRRFDWILLLRLKRKKKSFETKAQKTAAKVRRRRSKRKATRMSVFMCHDTIVMVYI